MKKPRQKLLARYGEHGHTVRVFQQGERVTVECRTAGLTKSYRGPDAAAKARGFAERFAKGGSNPIERPSLTIAALWEKYCLSSDYRALRERSVALYTDAWRLFVRVVPHLTPAEDVTAGTLEVVRTACEETPSERTKKPLSLNTIRKAISIVKTVFAWGERTEAIRVNRTKSFRFKIAKEKRVVSPDEFSGEEYQRMLAVLSFDKITERTPYSLLVLLGHQGARLNAATRLRWEDVLWDEDGGTILWRARWDKMGNEWGQGMRAPTRAILARLWDAAGRPATGWVFPSRHSKNVEGVYAKESFIAALHQIELRAGVVPRAGRGAHGLRRMVAGNVADLTGSSMKAMHAIGDKDVRLAEKYVKRRNPDVAKNLRDLDKETA